MSPRVAHAGDDLGDGGVDVRGRLALGGEQRGELRLEVSRPRVQEHRHSLELRLSHGRLKRSDGLVKWSQSNSARLTLRKAHALVELLA